MQISTTVYLSSRFLRFFLSYLRIVTMKVMRSYTKLLLATLISITFIFVLYYPIFQPSPVYNRNIEVRGWEAVKSRNTSLYVRPHEETVLMSGAKTCPPAPLILYIVVCSAMRKKEARRAIRDTWARHLPPSTAVVFFVGKSENETLMNSVQKEQATYQDLIQEDFIESYNNLTIATIMMLKSTLHHCSHIQYLMKADDDIYVNVNKLYNKLVRGEVPELSGELVRRARVLRNPKGKWYTPEYMFSEEYYPNYLSGVAYIMSREVANTLYNVSLQVPLLHHEDVFLTGICAHVAGLKPQRLVGVSRVFHNIDVCNAWYIVVHHISPSKLRSLWKPIAQHRCNLTAVSTMVGQ